MNRPGAATNSRRHLPSLVPDSNDSYPQWIHYSGTFRVRSGVPRLIVTRLVLLPAASRRFVLTRECLESTHGGLPVCRIQADRVKTRCRAGTPQLWLVPTSRTGTKTPRGATRRIDIARAEPAAEFSHGLQEKCTSKIRSQRPTNSPPVHGGWRIRPTATAAAATSEA